MTEQLAIFDPSGRPKISARRTNLEAIASIFRLNRGKWISAIDLMRHGGALSWRTRVSECRRLLQMDIVNRTERVNGVTQSMYRYRGPR